MSVKNSFEAAEKLSSEEISEDEQLISFDVEALYPSVPVDESIGLFSDWINEQDISDVDAQLYVNLLRLVMQQRWLEFEGKIYKQKEGLFIGNALSPILAEIFMGKLEEKAKEHSWFPRTWYRYVDDVIAVVKTGEETNILNELNKRHEAIKFTLEVEEAGSLPFLDLRLIRENGKISFDIYRKPTDAPLCIPRSSHHPWKYKVAAFESALFRMWNLPLTGERRQKELEYIVRMAQINGYDKKLVMKLNKKHKMRRERRDCTSLKPIHKSSRTSRTNDQKFDRRLVTIPYYSRMTNCLSNKLRTNGVNSIYQSKGSLKCLIGKVKKKRSRIESSGIYNIECEDCEGNYIGQTKRRIETREKEHARAITLKQPTKSALAEHCLDEGHNKGVCKVLKEVRNPFHLDAWESLYIAKGEELVNTGEPPIRSKLFEYTSIEKPRSF
jgi:hypothetical protein